jgi:hypothetical protein
LRRLRRDQGAKQQRGGVHQRIDPGLTQI